MLLDYDFGGSFLVIVYCWAFSCRVQGSRVFQLASQRALKKTKYLQITYFQQMGSKQPSSSPAKAMSLEQAEAIDSKK